jgi:cysteinyl-tRNA synthetase
MQGLRIRWNDFVFALLSHRILISLFDSIYSFRTYVGVDILQRILRYHFGLSLFHVMNITDIDDKILERCQREGKSVQQLSSFYQLDFFEDMTKLNVSFSVIISLIFIDFH